MTTGLTGLAAYLDDLIVTEETAAEHWEDLEKPMHRLGEYGFCIKLAKCEFFKDSVENLWHIIDKDRKRPSNTSVEAIQQLPKPQNLQELQALLGKII